MKKVTVLSKWSFVLHCCKPPIYCKPAVYKRKPAVYKCKLVVYNSLQCLWFTLVNLQVEIYMCSSHNFGGHCGGNTFFLNFLTANHQFPLVNW